MCLISSFVWAFFSISKAKQPMHAFLLISGSLNKDKKLNLTTNHRSPRAKDLQIMPLKPG
jgi:hypothetical protein